MKKPTKQEWLKHQAEMQLLAKQEALRNRYVFDPKTKMQFVKPRSITMLDEIKPLKKMKIDAIVTIRVPMTKKEVTAYVGKPCKDREVGCPTCDTWREWHLNYRYVTVQINRAEMVALMVTGKL
jgi:hypothetical protein